MNIRRYQGAEALWEVAGGRGGVLVVGGSKMGSSPGAGLAHVHGKFLQVLDGESTVCTMTSLDGDDGIPERFQSAIPSACFALGGVAHADNVSRTATRHGRRMPIKLVQIAELPAHASQVTRKRDL